MKFVDSNVFLRFLANPVTAEDERMHALASRFFASIESGEVQATTHEAVIHEVCYILTSSRYYGRTHEEAADYLRPLITFRSFHLPQRRILLRALDLFRSHRQLDFSDALSISYCEAEGHDLISFDRGIDRVPSAARSEP